MSASNTKKKNSRNAVSRNRANKEGLPMNVNIKVTGPSNEPRVPQSNDPDNSNKAFAETSEMLIGIPSMSVENTSDCLCETESRKSLMQERDEIMCRIKLDACRLSDVEKRISLLVRCEPACLGHAERFGTTQACRGDGGGSSTSQRQMALDLVQPRANHSMQQSVWDSASNDQTLHDMLFLERERCLTTNFSLSGRRLTPIRHPQVLRWNPAWRDNTPLLLENDQEVEVSRISNPALDVYVMATQTGEEAVATALRDTGCEATAITEDLAKRIGAHTVECQGGGRLLTINKEEIRTSGRCRLYIGLPGQDSLLGIDVYVVKTRYERNVGPKLFLSAGVVICTNLMPTLSMHERRALLPGVQ